MSFDPPKSRNEAILQNMLGANNVLDPPKSRVEKLLMQLLQQGGGGGSVAVDSAFSETSENPVQNKAITAAVGQIATYIDNLATYKADRSELTPFVIPITESGGTYTTTASAADIIANAYNCVAVVNGSRMTLDLASVNGNNATLIFGITSLDTQYPEVTNIFVTVQNGTVTVTVGSMDIKTLPTVTASDNGKFLRVVSGAWAAEAVPSYQGGSY